MAKYIYTDKNIDNNCRIIFLCGIEFRNTTNDKRRILQTYLQKDKRNIPLILEKHFGFEKTNKKMLLYDKLFLKNLFDIETLAALLVDSIIIIHESISTAAEFGIFASNVNLQDKLCLLVPDKYNIEDDKITGFLKYSFFHQKPRVSVVNFFPKVESISISDNISTYYTHFNNNEISYQLGQNINDFLELAIGDKIDISLDKFSKKNEMKSIMYKINTGNESIIAYINFDSLKYMIFALFSLSSFRGEIIKSKKLYESVSIIEKWIKDIIKNTILEHIGKCETFVFTYILNSGYSSGKLREAIAFSLYILQAMEIIKLPFEDKRFMIHKKNKKFYEQFSPLIAEIHNLII